MRIILVSIGVIALIIAGLLYFTKPFSPHKNHLIIGTAAGYAPFMSVNAQGEYEGFDHDIAKALAAQLNKKLVLKDLGSMTSLFTALQQGSIDAIIWGLSITKQRLEQVAMVHYQGDTVNSYPLLFWDAIPQGVSLLEDMPHAIICVEPGSSQEIVLSEYPSIRPLMVEKIDDALLNIRYAKADAALVEPAIAKKFMAKYSNIRHLEVPLSENDKVQGVGIAIKKSNISLIKSLQNAVGILKSHGIINQSARRWNIE